MKLQLLDKGGAHLVGFAKKKLNQLEELRKSTGMPFLSKKFEISGYLVEITAHQYDWLRLIRIK